MVEHRTVEVPLGSQEALFSKGYVWQSRPHRGVRDSKPHKYAKSLKVYLDKGLISFAYDEANSTIGDVPVFTGDKWWDK